MLNSVGWKIRESISSSKRICPYLAAFRPKIIVNVVEKKIADYCAVVEKLSDSNADMLEINISCPNIKEGGISFGADPKMAAELTREIRKNTRKPFLMKLTPNVTDIAEIARSVESEGADGISMINTLLVMWIDVHKQQARPEE
jgi:dihydroorotate dehydrogenase (NAD+) catalytic subunit